MDKQNYKPRIIDRQVEKYLSAFGAVCIEGPKWCGKTWTSSYHSKSEIYIGDPAGNFQNRQLAELSPALILDGETPRLIDEWQEVPPLWDAVRYKVDQSAQKGQFILTGSATPNHKGILHSGAGRIARLRMRPMSLWESGDSSGKVSLEQLCYGTLTPAMTDEVDLKKLIELIIRGGWPGSLGLPLEQAALLPAQYLDAVIDDDVYRIDGIKRDTQKMRLLLRSLARNESTTVTNKTLMKDIKAVDDEDIDGNTVAAYHALRDVEQRHHQLHPVTDRGLGQHEPDETLEGHLRLLQLGEAAAGLDHAGGKKEDKQSVSNGLEPAVDILNHRPDASALEILRAGADERPDLRELVIPGPKGGIEVVHDPVSASYLPHLLSHPRPTTAAAGGCFACRRISR